MSKILKVVGASWMQTKISSYILGLLGVLAILALFFGQMERSQEDGNYAATVFYNEKTGYSIEFWGQSNELAQIQRGVARAYFRMDIDTTGWSLLEVETDGSYPDEVQAYAAGVIEGALTWSLIHKHLENTVRAKCDGTALEKQCNKLKDTLDKAVDKWKSYAADRSSTDPLWHQICLYYTQINGIFTGWKHGVERSQCDYDTDVSDLYWLNSMAEVAEIQRILNISLEDSTFQKVPDLSTAFVRIANETSEDGTTTKKLYIAQNKAGSYSSMTRILKRYKLNYHLTSMDTTVIPGQTVEFSGYPGSITSQDEFYLIRGKHHRLAISGTPLRNFNDKLWKDVNITEQVPASPRIYAANHLAVNGSSWAHVLASSNSGSASKQWLLLDYNKLDQHHVSTHTHSHFQHSVRDSETNGVKHFVAYHNHSHGKGLLFLVEQVPGRTHSADISDILLDQHYWATYGLPFFKDVTVTTHVTKMEEKYGSIFSETNSPRAAIFRRSFKNATSLDSIIQLMRQNNVTAMNRASNETTECYGLLCLVEEEGYWSVLGVRGDIVRQNKEPYGVIDTKVISGAVNETSLNFTTVAGPSFTEIAQTNKTKINKGNIAPFYTHQFDNKPDMNGLQIKNLVLQQRKEAEQEYLDILNKDAVKPFQWSTSDYKSRKHIGLPDTWAFTKFQPKWSW